MVFPELVEPFPPSEASFFFLDWRREQLRQLPGLPPPAAPQNLSSSSTKSLGRKMGSCHPLGDMRDKAGIQTLSSEQW